MAQSILDGSLIITGYTVKMIDNIVPVGAKRDNAQTAVLAFAAEYNTSFASASLVDYTMG